jgi:rSAM-associated Gly-rich repeat protein
MPQNRSAGLLAFLLSLPSLALVAPPPGEASATASTTPESGASADVEPLPAPGSGTAAEGPRAETIDARLQRLSAEIRARAGALEAGQLAGLEGEPWLMAGGWWNGNNRGWVNRGWPNRVQGGSYYRSPQVWANFRPGWGNFRNGPRFINW